MRLADLGPRICILGPSNSGKSTLAEAIGRKLGLPVVHLDRLYHQPHTDWRPRPEAEFLALHDRAIAAEAWVMDGNYSVCLDRRLARASGLILLDVSVATSLLRYVRRCWRAGERAGGLEGAPERVKWLLVHHIAFVAPGNRRRYRARFARLGLPKLALPSPSAVAAFYRAENLSR